MFKFQKEFIDNKIIFTSYKEGVDNGDSFVFKTKEDMINKIESFERKFKICKKSFIILGFDIYLISNAGPYTIFIKREEFKKFGDFVYGDLNEF